MTISLGGIDDLVFTGGIGSHAHALRSAIGELLRPFGAVLEARSNQTGATRIDAPASAVRVWVLKVGEECEMARNVVSAEKGSIGALAPQPADHLRGSGFHHRLVVVVAPTRAGKAAATIAPMHRADAAHFTRTMRRYFSVAPSQIVDVLRAGTGTTPAAIA